MFFTLFFQFSIIYILALPQLRVHSFYCMLISSLNTRLTPFASLQIFHLYWFQVTSGLDTICLSSCPRASWDPAYTCIHTSWKCHLKSASRANFCSPESKAEEKFPPLLSLSSWFGGYTVTTLMMSEEGLGHQVLSLVSHRSPPSCSPSLLICFLSSHSPMPPPPTSSTPLLHRITPGKSSYMRCEFFLSEESQQRHYESQEEQP